MFHLRAEVAQTLPHTETNSEEEEEKVHEHFEPVREPQFSLPRNGTVTIEDVQDAGFNFYSQFLTLLN